MNTRDAYNAWARSYDSMDNKTRDLEQTALHTVLHKLAVERVLELGCGTGKNTAWLSEQAKEVMALDFSPEMLARARKKIDKPNVTFQEADLLEPWPVPNPIFELVTCSLVLEHIENLVPLFAKAAAVLRPGGFMYVCELHPLRQYKGKGAHFHTSDGKLVAPSNFLHHLSDYTQAAVENGFSIQRLDEWFDLADRSGVPRLVSFLFRLS